MSLDFGLYKSKACMFNANITHNLAPMWRLAGIYDALYNSHGKKALEVIHKLIDGHVEMVSSPDKFKKLNPENGWGDYDCALEFLEEVIIACLNFPNAKIDIDK